jgi:hypothetical protein
MESLPVVKNRNQIVALPKLNPTSKLNADNTVFMLSFWILSQKIYSHQLTKEEANQLTRMGHCFLPVKESMFQIMKLSFQNDKKFSQKLRSIRQKNTNTHSSNSSSGSSNPTTTTADSTSTTSTAGTTTAAKHVDATEHPNNNNNNNNSNNASTTTTDSSNNYPLVVAKIHCIRLDTNQTCTLYHGNLPRFEMQHSNANSDEVRFPVQRALSNTEVGDQFVAEWFHGWPEGIRNFGGLTFSVKITKEKIHVESIIFGAPGQSDHLKSRNGVSAFHIMEGLSGWN